MMREVAKKCVSCAFRGCRFRMWWLMYVGVAYLFSASVVLPWSLGIVVLANVLYFTCSELTHEKYLSTESHSSGRSTHDSRGAITAL